LLRPHATGEQRQSQANDKNQSFHDDDVVAI
jgi:hypothetical protein